MLAAIKPISGVDDRVSLAEAIPLSTPFTMNIFPTGMCNFRCNYCAQSLGAVELKKRYNFTYDTMTLDTFEKVVDGMTEFKSKFKLLSFMGHGEPLLNKELPRMIAMAKKADVAKRIEIITNGSLLTHDLSNRLVEAGLSNLRVSLQGITSEKYWQISRAKLDFGKFLNELKYFSSLSTESKLYVKVVDTSLDAGEEEKFYELFGDFANRMYVEHIKPVYDGVEYGKKQQDIMTDRYGNTHTHREVCPLPFYMLAVWPHGDVAPCDAIYNPVMLGNVYTDKLTDMWQSDKMRNFLLMHLKKKRAQYAGCKSCCAPDDVSHPLDVLDDHVESLMSKI